MQEEMNLYQHQPQSPLAPLKNTLKILKFIGWPLKFANNECTEVRRRNVWLLPIIWVVWMLGFFGIESSFLYFSGFSLNESHVIMRKENIKTWDHRSLWIFTVPNWIRPWGMLYFYKDVESDLTYLLKFFVLVGAHLPEGIECFLAIEVLNR